MLERALRDKGSHYRGELYTVDIIESDTHAGLYGYTKNRCQIAPIDNVRVDSNNYSGLTYADVS